MTDDYSVTVVNTSTPMPCARCKREMHKGEKVMKIKPYYVCIPCAIKHVKQKITAWNDVFIILKDNCDDVTLLEV